MARDYRLISADSHVLEPRHLWTQYMPERFHHKVPWVVPDGDGGEAWQFAPDVPPVDEMFRDVPAEERQRICALNAATLYKLI